MGLRAASPVAPLQVGQGIRRHRGPHPYFGVLAPPVESLPICTCTTASKGSPHLVLRLPEGVHPALEQRQEEVGGTSLLGLPEGGSRQLHLEGSGDCG